MFSNTFATSNVFLKNFKKFVALPARVFGITFWPPLVKCILPVEGARVRSSLVLTFENLPFFSTFGCEYSYDSRVAVCRQSVDVGAAYVSVHE